MIIGAPLTKEQIIDIGMDLTSQLFKFNVIQEELSTIIQLNVLGIVYSVNMPTSETNDEKNVKDAWKQALETFGVAHMLGQKGHIQHGSRDLDDSELKLIEK